MLRHVLARERRLAWTEQDAEKFVELNERTNGRMDLRKKPYHIDIIRL